METTLNHPSAREHDLELFLDSLGVHFREQDKQGGDGYIVVHLDPAVGMLFEANGNKAALLAYRVREKIFPLFLAFLKGADEIEFCHTTLLLDAYRQGMETAGTLRAAAAEFFPPEIEDLMAKLGLTWTGAPIHGDLDCPIYWETKPEIGIVTDLLL